MPPLKLKKELKTTKSVKKKTKANKVMEIGEAQNYEIGHPEGRAESPLTPAIIRGNPGFDDYLGKKMMVWHQNKRVQLTTQD